MTRHVLNGFGLAAALGVMLSTQPAMARAEGHEGPPPEGLVWYVLNALNGLYLDVEDPTNRPPLLTVVPDGVLEPVAVNGDGRPDWLIRWPEQVEFCGTGGCRVTLYISADDGFVRAFDRQALRFEVKAAGAHQVEAVLHAVHCRDDQGECRWIWEWDAGSRRLRVAASSDGADRSEDPAPVESPDDPCR